MKNKFLTGRRLLGLASFTAVLALGALTVNAAPTNATSISHVSGMQSQGIILEENDPIFPLTNGPDVIAEIPFTITVNNGNADASANAIIRIVEDDGCICPPAVIQQLRALQIGDISGSGSVAPTDFTAVRLYAGVGPGVNPATRHAMWNLGAMAPYRDRVGQTLKDVMDLCDENPFGGVVIGDISGTGTIAPTDFTAVRLYAGVGPGVNPATRHAMWNLGAMAPYRDRVGQPMGDLYDAGTLILPQQN